jgi:hypothetical protein
MCTVRVGRFQDAWITSIGYPVTNKTGVQWLIIEEVKYYRSSSRSSVTADSNKAGEVTNISMAQALS